MRLGIIFGMLLSGIGFLVFIIGGFSAGSLFFYGIYYMIFRDIANGLMLIGASMVGTFICRFISSLLMAAGSSISTKCLEQHMRE